MKSKIISVTSNTPITVRYIREDDAIVPAYVSDRVSSLLRHDEALKAFLSVQDILHTDCELLQEEEGSFGHVLRFSFETEKGPIGVYAKLQHSVDPLEDFLKRDHYTRPTLVHYEPMDGSITFRFPDDEHVYTRYGFNPTLLEHEFTMEASRIGITPPSCVLAGTLLVKAISDGISLYDLIRDKEFTELFIRDQETFMKKLGIVYGVLNKRLRIIHNDVRERHVFMTRDGDVQIIDFSTWKNKSITTLSERVVAGETPENGDLHWLSDMIWSWMSDFSALKAWSRSQGIGYFQLKTLYRDWLYEGYESVPEQEELL